MQLHTNGTRALALVPTIEATDPAADFDDLDEQIACLSAALIAAKVSRNEAADAEELMERIEASHILTIEGGNDAQRRARLTLTLADDRRYQDARTAHRTARNDLADAEREAQLAKERIRLLRLTIESRISTERP